MADKRIPYDDLMQNALRGVVRDVLKDVAAHGLPGEHHFYIAFRTAEAGVVIPKRMRERYPDDMTIVIQHRFSGLVVHEDRFEIVLSFNQKPEHLVIPFAAILGFVDPSVQFALQFQDQEAANQEESAQDIKPPQPDKPTAPSHPGDTVSDDDKVVALDAFRKKS